MASDTDQRPLSALLVDDELVFREFLGKLLSVRYGFTVTVAASFDEARTLLSARRFDLVVTDVVLEPSQQGQTGSGFDVIHEVRRLFPETPIIAMSSYLPRYHDELEKLGVSVVDKQGGTATFRQAVEGILEKRSTVEHTAPPATAARASDLRLDDVRRVFAEEAARLLSSKERVLSVPDEGHFELPKPLQGFKQDIERQLLRFPFARNVFLMMKFRHRNRDISDYIAQTLRAHDLCAIRADDAQWNITGSVYNPVAVLYCCKYGIALFDQPDTGEQAYSPNVAYELGMMHLQNKRCLILRHDSLPQMPFDLIKDLYETYERDLQLKTIIERWIGGLRES